MVIENVFNAINQISQTTVRNVVGRFSLDQLLSAASINEQIKNVIDGHTEPWGTQVTAVRSKTLCSPKTCNGPWLRRQKPSANAARRSSLLKGSSKPL